MERIRELRAEMGLSQVKLAVKADMDPATLNRLEQGKGNPNIKTLERLAAAMGVEVADFFPRSEPRLPLENLRVAGALTLDAGLLRTICESMADHYEDLAGRDVPPSRALGWWDVAPYDAGYVLAMVDVLLRGVQDGSIVDDEGELLPLLRAAYRLAHFADALWRKSVGALGEEVRQASAKLQFWQATEGIALTEAQREAIVS